MKLSISRAPARAAVLAAITARTFVTMTVDAPPTHNGAYLCPLIAAALALPWLLCVRALNRRMDARAVTALSAALLPLVLLDAAVTAGEITGSAGYLALDRVPERLLLLPVCADAAAGTDYAPIATFTSYYVVGSEDVGVHGKEINIGVNCRDMNGRVIASGETIDYDSYFGPYLPSKDYVKGPVLLDYGWGLGPGGGVCQVSSTLYNVLAQLPGVNVIYHTSHGSNGIAYLPLDMDAAVGNPDHAIDLIFRNEYPFALRFEALAQNGTLFLALYRVTE